MKLSVMSGALCLIAAASSLALDNVKLVTGSRYYGSVQRDDGMDPPTENELRDAAKQSALKQLGNQNEYVQITPWKIWSYCEPLRRGSPLCISGHATYKASFVLKGDELKDWYITTEGVVSQFINDPGNSREEARTTARSNAEFACANRRVVELNNAKVWCNKDEHPENGWCKLHYQVTFMCPMY